MTADEQTIGERDDALAAAAEVEILDTDEAGGRFIRGGALRVAGYVAGVLLGLASTPVMVRHLGVDDFGRYITVSSLIFIVGGLTDAGLTNIGVREYSTRSPSARRRFLRNLVGMRSALTLVAISVAVAFAVGVGYPHVMVAGTLVAGIGLFAQNLFLTATVPLATGLRLGWIAALDFIRQLVTAAAFIGLVVLGASLLPFFWVSVFGASVVFVLTLVLVRREAPLLPAFDFGEWRSLLRETLPYAAAAALGVVYFRVAVILMSLISTNEQTGYFSVSFRILEIVAGVPWLLVTSAFPILARAARDDRDRLRYALQRLFDVSMLASGWMALMMGVGAPFAIGFVGGAGFEQAVPVLRILGAALVGTFLVATWGFALLSLHRHRALLVANAIAIVVGGVLTLLLVPHGGAKGGAIATSVTEVCLAFSYGVALVRARRDLRPALFVVPRVAAAAALGVLPALLFDLPSIVEAAIATVIYFAFLFIAQAVPDELREALFRGGRSSRSG